MHVMNGIIENKLDIPFLYDLDEFLATHEVKNFIQEKIIKKLYTKNIHVSIDYEYINSSIREICILDKCQNEMDFWRSMEQKKNIQKIKQENKPDDKSQLIGSLEGNKEDDTFVSYNTPYDNLVAKETPDVEEKSIEEIELKTKNRLNSMTKREKEVWLCIEDYITNEKGKITQEKLAEYVSLETNEHISRQSLKLLLERAAKKADIDLTFIKLTKKEKEKEEQKKVVIDMNEFIKQHQQIKFYHDYIEKQNKYNKKAIILPILNSCSIDNHVSTKEKTKHNNKILSINTFILNNMDNIKKTSHKTLSIDKEKQLIEKSHLMFSCKHKMDIVFKNNKRNSDIYARYGP